MAAYACTLPGMPPDPVEMGDEGSQMGMEVVQEAPAICAEHCSPDHAVAPDTGFAHVPPLALPPVHFEPRVVPPPAHQVLAGQRLVARSHPPPRLRYCSLLILTSDPFSPDPAICAVVASSGERWIGKECASMSRTR